MIKAKKSKKPLIIALSVILGIFVTVAAFFGIYYLSADALIYHYVNLSAEVTCYASSYDKVGETRGKEIKYPFFGNPLVITEEAGATYGFPFGAGEKNIPVYIAINDPISTWIFYLGDRYKNNAAVDYTVEMDSEYITVNFTGTLTEKDEVIPIEQKFVISIKNASLDNLPTWVNEDEISEGYRDFLFYLRNIGTAEPPDWMADYSK